MTQAIYPGISEHLVRLRRYLGSKTDGEPQLGIPCLKEIMRHPGYDASVADSILSMIAQCTHQSVRLECLERLLKSSRFLPNKDAVAEIVIHSGYFELVPLLVKRRHIPEKISDVQEDRLLTFLSSRWSYLNVFCPNVLLDQDSLEFSSKTLLLGITSPSGERILSEYLALPRHDYDAIIFNKEIRELLNRPSGVARFCQTFTDDAGERGKLLGMLISAGLVDTPALLAEQPESSAVRAVLADGEAWALQHAAPSAGIKKAGRTARL